jgi:putative glutamine amidotransferase
VEILPVVGVTAGEHDARWGAWGARAVLLTSAYLRAVESAGGVPVVLPPAPGAAERLVGRLDALILTGGADVDPARYGQDRHPATRVADPARDRFELELAVVAGEAGLPLLAVCRGAQVLNVARGGTLHQHLPDLGGTVEHAAGPGSYGRHRVRIEPGSRVGLAMGGAAGALVPTHHHQGVDRAGTGLHPAAWADDGTVEAIEDPAASFLLGVQWHPEQGEDMSLFEALVGAAAGGGRRPGRVPGPVPGPAA